MGVRRRLGCSALCPDGRPRLAWLLPYVACRESRGTRRNAFTLKMSRMISENRVCPRTGDTVGGKREHGTRRALTHAVRIAPWRATPMQTGQQPHLPFPHQHHSSTSRDTEDEGLIRRLAARDPEAFTTLYQRYAPRLAGFLRPRLVQPDLVDDVLHETLVVVWQDAARFRGQAQLSTGIFRIAQRKAHQTRVACQRASAPASAGALRHRDLRLGDAGPGAADRPRTRVRPRLVHAGYRSAPGLLGVHGQDPAAPNA